MEYLFYLMVGSIAGLISGLFGLGGGAVIVPLLIFTFLARGIPAEITTHLAIGTSLGDHCIYCAKFYLYPSSKTGYTLGYS
jgi:uncharacterized membrane protein YfcA